MVVARLKADNPHIRDKGFSKCLMDLITTLGLVDEVPADKKGRRRFEIIPDAYIFDPDFEVVTAYEVEDTHPLTPAKLSIYADIFWILDQKHWLLKLIVLDRYGKNERVLDLFDWSINIGITHGK